MNNVHALCEIVARNYLLLLLLPLPLCSDLTQRVPAPPVNPVCQTNTDKHLIALAMYAASMTSHRLLVKGRHVERWHLELLRNPCPCVDPYHFCILFSFHSKHTLSSGHYVLLFHYHPLPSLHIIHSLHSTSLRYAPPRSITSGLNTPISSHLSPTTSLAQLNSRRLSILQSRHHSRRRSRHRAVVEANR